MSRRNRRRDGRKKRSAGLRVALVLLVVSAGVAVWTWWAIGASPEGNPEEVEIRVPQGASGQEIVTRLADRGLAPRPTLAYWFLRLEGALNRVQAGTHVLPGDASILDLAELLRQPARAPQVALTLVPGESIWQAGARIEAAGLGTGVELATRASDRALAVELGLPVGGARAERRDGVPHTWLEGFLYPDTYFFAPDAGIDAVIRRATARFREVWAEVRGGARAELASIQQRYGLDEHDVIVLASLVEEEARRPKEAPRIAGVFYNRLDRGMKLQTDPTLMYHPERVGRAPTPTERRDASNPYNTYAVEGLPPGPICSPGRGALEAALGPERHDYLYFVARRDGGGGHAFARTLDEHRDNIRRYLGGAGETVRRP